MHKAHEVLGLVPSTVTNKTKDVPKNCLVTQLTYNHRARLRKEFRGNGWCTDIQTAGVKVAAGQGDEQTQAQDGVWPQKFSEARVGGRRSRFEGIWMAGMIRMLSLKPPPYSLRWPGPGPLLGLCELTARFSWSLLHWNVAQYRTGTAWTGLLVASSRHSGNSLPNSAVAKWSH